MEELTFDQVQVGQTLGPVAHEVTRDFVRRFAEATGDRHPEYLTEAPVAHPLLATLFSTRLMGRVGIDRPSGGIHAAQAYAFLAPLRAGQTVTTTGRVTAKFIRRDRKYVEFEALTVDAAGQPIVRCTVTSILGR
jgi:acyl dehydratase